jgi:hypothetical protein
MRRLLSILVGIAMIPSFGRAQANTLALLGQPAIASHAAEVEVAALISTLPTPALRSEPKE